MSGRSSLANGASGPLPCATAEAAAHGGEHSVRRPVVRGSRAQAAAASSSKHCSQCAAAACCAALGVAAKAAAAAKQLQQSQAGGSSSALSTHSRFVSKAAAATKASTATALESKGFGRQQRGSSSKGERLLTALLHCIHYVHLPTMITHEVKANMVVKNGRSNTKQCCPKPMILCLS